MAAVDTAEAQILAESRAEAGHLGEQDVHIHTEKKYLKVASSDSASDSSGHTEGAQPNERELSTLRRVGPKIHWIIMTVAFVEFCERFSYYGTTQVFQNFIQQPLPKGSTTGASGKTDQAGALGMGQQAATGLTTFNQFWAYVCPLLGGIIADQYLGRYATIQWSILFALVGHICLIVSALPPVIQNPHGAIAAFVIGLVIMGMGTGGFKSNIAPLIAEQVQDRTMRVKKLDSGEWIISDPFVTISRVYLWFYFMINVGALAGGIGMAYTEYYVGYWLAYTLPTILFLFAPVVLWLAKSRYVLMPPTGSIVAKATKLLWMGIKKKASANPVKFYKGLKDPTFWEDIKPSKVPNRPRWMTGIDDAWVEQVRRGLSACKVFAWYPLYWLAYNQQLNNLVSQAATMQRDGVPNDVINNFNPITLLIFIPVMDKLVYPSLRKARIRFTPLKRITTGFFLASAAMISSTVQQYYIYKLSACGDHPAEGPKLRCTAPISVWVQIIPYAVVAFSEIMASITGLEYAFTKAPENMRSLVQGIYLLQTAFASALNQALVPLATDPLLVWNYGVVSVLAFVGGAGFWLTWRKLDKEEDHLNTLEETDFKGKKPPLADDIELEGGRSSDEK